MKRYFNIEGGCRPEEHYMVRLDERLKLMKEQYVDRGKYFVINRGRQYGKTTTLMALAEYLKTDYIVLHMDFQLMDSSSFENVEKFVTAFIEYLEMIFADNHEQSQKLDNNAVQELISIKDSRIINMDKMFRCISRLCETSKLPVVMIIDEVDSASNNQVFIDFLAQLRGYYLKRSQKSTFHAVVLAGVYDIKNLKLKIRPDEEHQYNSPWNIAAKFNIEMAFSAKQIASMLQEYEMDNHTGMDINETAQCIYEYTSGYPYLVSAICKMLDEDIPQMEQFSQKCKAWSREAIEEAVKIMQKDNISLFGSMARQLDEYKDMRSMIEEIIYQGKRIPFSLQVKPISLGVMFGFLKEKNGCVAVSNRIFEMVLLDMFAAENAAGIAFGCGERDRSQFIQSGRLDMDLVLAKFVEYFNDIYGDNTEKFLEENGRKFFLLFLKPIINGTGNYYLEAQTRDARRTDVIVDYLGEQFIIEMKIWHGNEYNKRGEEQLTEYLDYYHLERGYMLSFNFNKEKETGVKEIKIGNKTIMEAVV